MKTLDEAIAHVEAQINELGPRVQFLNIVRQELIKLKRAPADAPIASVAKDLSPMREDKTPPRDGMPAPKIPSLSESQRIYDFVKGHPGTPLHVIAKTLKIEEWLVRDRLHRLVHAGAIKRTHYRPGTWQVKS